MKYALCVFVASYDRFFFDTGNFRASYVMSGYDSVCLVFIISFDVQHM